MKTLKLNLEDKPSWQKFQHVLTSFASDYIDIIAPEQTVFKLEQKTLRLGFVLVDRAGDRQRINAFTQNLETFLGRLPILEVRRVEIELVDISTDEILFGTGFELTYRPAVSALSRSSSVAIQLHKITTRAKAWLTHPATVAKFNKASRLVVRQPKTSLAIAGTLAKEKFVATLDWIDTFPWEAWAKNRVADQRRRHQRNLFKAIVEDILIIALIGFLAITVVDRLSTPTINFAALPNQHYDKALDIPPVRCDWSGLSKRNYVCLQRGMSYQQVVNILGGEGKPLGIDPRFGDRAVIVSWQNEVEAMNVTFRENYLVAKAYRKLDT